jgi:type II secretory pathway pseudopilin PulG
MLVATFGPTTAWQGREIIWDVDRFILVGHGAIPAAGVLDYDRLGQLVWAQPELRAWVAEVHRWETGGQPAAAGVAPAGGAGASGRRGLPAWAIVLIVVAVVFVVLSIIIAAVVPSFIMRTTEGFANDVMVRAGVQAIDVGIESYAAAHGGQYPPAGEVNAIGLGAYISAWPVNPYTDLPMVDGGGAGNYRYDVSPDGGVYKLMGYGRDGQIVIDLSGGSGQSV